MKDYLVRGMSMDGFVKAVAIRSTELVRRGAQIQKTSPNATAAFGRCLTAASMMGNMQKVEDGSMTLQVRGGGPIGTITVVSDSVGNVRGCVTEQRVPLVEKYPERFMLGSDVVGRFNKLGEEMRSFTPFLDALPEDVARKVARDNFLAILPRTAAKSGKSALNR